MQFAAGFALGILVAAIAYAVGALTRSGALAAAILGGVTFGAGGLPAAVLLLAFFVSSSALSRAGRFKKHNLVVEVEKGARRDQLQVLANGSVAGICALGFGLSGAPIWFVGLAGALGAVTADTWSTELGVLARDPPRLILGGAEVQPGTSGGITRQGSLASIAGATLIGLLAWLVFREWSFLLAVSMGGFLGAVVDSLLGASVQAQYYCPECEKVTERHPQHACGSRTSLIRGWPWLNNDGVNFAASIAGALVSVILWVILNRGSA